MDIAFGVLSAHEPEASVRQLVGSLGDADPVFVHHDYSRQPDFSLGSSQAYLIPDHVATRWGSSDLAKAVFHLIRTALKGSRFDYFQLLSASCLPLRPMTDLRRHLGEARHAIHCDILNLDADEDVMMSHGHRVFCRVDTVASRLLRRSRRWYLGDDPPTVQQANLGIAGRPNASAKLTALQWLGKKVHVAARHGLLDDHPFHGNTAPLVGSLWFCLRRDVCEYLVDQESKPFTRYLMNLKVCDEILFPSILGNSGFDIVPSNHLVSDFAGSHPRIFSLCDLPKLEASSKFFARKFAPDARDEVRRVVLSRLDHRGEQGFQSALIPPARISSPHFRVSSATKASTFCGSSPVPGS